MDIEGLEKDSRQRYLLLGRSIIELSGSLVGEQEFGYFVVTADLANDMFYAPLTNCAPTSLKEALDETRYDQSIETLRTTFRLSHGSPLRQFLVDLARKRAGSVSRTVVIADIAEGGVLTSPRVIVGDGALEAIFDGSIVLSEDIVRRVNELSAGRSPRWFVIGAGGDPGPAKVGRSQLVQLGVLFGGTAAAEQVMERILSLSQWAALVLHYDRERYYQKALRQAVRGSIVKMGDGSDIQQQTARLLELGQRPGALLPVVRRRDPVDNPPADSEEAATSWYEMPRYVMPSLLDIFTTTHGLESYEILSLIRSAFEHLREVFWLKEVTRVPARANASLYAVLGVAAERVNAASANFAARFEQIAAAEPVKHRRRIHFYSRREFEPYARLIEFAKGKTKTMWVKTRWFEGPWKEIKCSRPQITLRKLRAAIDKLSADLDVAACSLRPGGVLHGDPHFGNFLMDASIPEDPLVASIDPASTLDTTRLLRPESVPKSGAQCDGVTFSASVHALASDPSYDIAKLFVSTACLYPLASKRAFDIKISKAGELRVSMERPKKPLPEKLDASGGVSGAQLVTLSPAVPPASLRYHAEANEYVLGEVRRLFSAALKDAHEPVGSIAYAWVRLWLLTVRHAFSLADHMFLAAPDRGVTMFVLALSFLQFGSPIALQIIRDPSSAGELAETMFRLPLLASALDSDR